MGNFGHVYCPLRGRLGESGLRWEYRFMVSLEDLLFTQKPLSHDLGGFAESFLYPFFFSFFSFSFVRHQSTRKSQ